jgi:hypothetical protein
MKDFGNCDGGSPTCAKAIGLQNKGTNLSGNVDCVPINFRYRHTTQHS